MHRNDLPDRFSDLPGEEQARLLEAADAMCRLVYRHTTAILVTGSPGPHSNLRNGSGFVLRLDDKHYLGTAWHVVESWQRRRAKGEEVAFQVGRVVLEPEANRVWADEANDIAFVPLSVEQLSGIDAAPVDPVRGWPPPSPVQGDYVLVCGFPGEKRHLRTQDEVELLAVSTLLQVKRSGPTYIACQFEREHWISNNWDAVPPPGSDLGGISGGPVLLVQDLAYPLVGLVSEFSTDFEILYLNTFNHLPPKL